MNIKAILMVMVALAIMSCSGKKKRGIDFAEFKKEVTLTPEQEKNFDEITAKYKKQQEQNYEAAKAQGGQMDRVALGIKNEELRAQQSLEMGSVLKADQLVKFNEFVEKNSRKRPRYTNELLEKIRTEAQLTNEQFTMLNASNDAFEKAFNDAHDIYHGNTDLAREYWNKFDVQRKEAMKTSLYPEQYEKFLELVKDQQFKGRE